MDHAKLKRRAPGPATIRLEGPFEPVVAPRLGARFPATTVKERDLLDPPGKA
ncbi:MAG TPA: hypothetical protein VHH36_04125 [Candidatus Thermoplasmatota archaeon]|nr:hypothetical protein [Candidatus Thermoplasmatota archaeon]